MIIGAYINDGNDVRQEGKVEFFRDVSADVEFVVVKKLDAVGSLLLGCISCCHNRRKCRNACTGPFRGSRFPGHIKGRNWN